MRLKSIEPHYNSVPADEKAAKPDLDQDDSSTNDSPDGSIKSPMARLGRLYAKRHTRRLIQKDGTSNIFLGHVDKKKTRFMSDIFTNMLEMKWRFVMLLFTGAFIFSWLFFAIIYFVILKAHGDDKHIDDEDWQKCMTNVYDFTTAFLFSLETQHTIGYGFRAMEPKCPEATLVLMVQSCAGVFIQSLMTGFIFAKLSRPKRRASTIMFTKNAVICLRDGVYVLLIRVADMRKSHIVNSNIRAVFISNRITKEGEIIPLDQQPLHVEAENAVDYYLFLSMPTTIVHRINQDSPLWKMSPDQILSQHFEILVYMEGTVEYSGMTVQARTSYLPSEILWGHRLRPLVTYQKDGGEYRVDSGQFHNTYEDPAMPDCSAENYANGNMGIATGLGLKRKYDVQHSCGPRISETPSTCSPKNSDAPFTIGPAYLSTPERNRAIRQHNIFEDHLPKPPAKNLLQDVLSRNEKRRRNTVVELPNLAPHPEMVGPQGEDCSVPDENANAKSSKKKKKKDKHSKRNNLNAGDAPCKDELDTCAPRRRKGTTILDFSGFSLHSPPVNQENKSSAPAPPAATRQTPLRGVSHECPI